MLKIGVEHGVSGSWIESSLRFAAHQLAEGRVESPSILAKLAELLFMEAVRRHVESLPPETSGWLTGLRDPVVGRALALLHSQMAHRWGTRARDRAFSLRLCRAVYGRHGRAAHALFGELADAVRRAATAGFA